MIAMEDWVTIRTLRAKNPNISYREIGRLLNISQNTVKKAQNNDNPPEYKRSGRVNFQLEPFKEVICEMINVRRYKGSRVLEEIRSKGYRGGKTAFYDYLAKVKIDSKRDFTRIRQLPGFSRNSTGVPIRL